MDYITKPFQIEEVLARVRVQIALHSALEQLTHQVHHLQQTSEQLALDIADHEKAKEDLDAVLKRLQTLNVKISKGRNEERRELAYELHEQLGQEIAALLMNLRLLKTKGIGKETQAHLLAAQSTAKAVLERIRNMSQNLGQERHG